jgi:hypothetical protein
VSDPDLRVRVRTQACDTQFHPYQGERLLHPTFDADSDFPCFRAWFHTTRVTMNLIRRKITCTIDRNQIAAVHKDHWFQNLPALEFAENIFE